MKISLQDFLALLPEDRKEPFMNLRTTIVANLPEGFEESIESTGIAYEVPHSLYPDGYHCNPGQPLPFINIASQKNFIAIYHLGIYAKQELLSWFESEYPKHSKTKLDMGKSCIRFKNPNQIPLELIAALVKKIDLKEWINIYETTLKKN